MVDERVFACDTIRISEVNPDRSAKADAVSVIITTFQAIPTISNLRSSILAVVLISSGIPLLVAAALPAALKAQV